MLDTILIADGDAAQLHITKQAISEKLKYKTLAASTSEEAINLGLSPDANPSLMLLDMRMPQINALHIISIIKNHKPDFPIIIMTEYGNNSYAVEAIKAGANDFVTKPVAIERLGLSIASALRISNLCKVIERLERQLADGKVNHALPSRLRTANSIYSSQNGLLMEPSPLQSDGRIKKLRALEEDAIRFALNVCGGSMSKAARSLGIGRSTLYRKIDELERHNNNGSSYISRENHTTRPMMAASDMEHS